MEIHEENLIEIDGSYGEGGGQILRTALLSLPFQRNLLLSITSDRSERTLGFKLSIWKQQRRWPELQRPKQKGLNLDRKKLPSYPKIFFQEIINSK